MVQEVEIDIGGYHCKSDCGGAGDAKMFSSPAFWAACNEEWGGLYEKVYARCGYVVRSSKSGFRRDADGVDH